MPRHALLLATVLLLCAGTAAAAFKPTFEQADRNDDSRVTIQEAMQAGIPEKLARQADLDKDNVLHRNDWKYIHFKTRKKESGDLMTPKGSWKTLHD